MVSSGRAMCAATSRGTTRKSTGCGGQCAQRVNLFRHAHRAEFGGDGGTDAPGDHQRREYRAEFVAQGNCGRTNDSSAEFARKSRGPIAG